MASYQYTGRRHLRGREHSYYQHGSYAREADTANMPCGHRMGSRNLVVCIDGTSNQFGTKVCFEWFVILPADTKRKNTNVIELYNLISKEVEDNQQTWYNSGIGTYARPSWKSFNFYKQVLYHKIDLGIAWCVQALSF